MDISMTTMQVIKLTIDIAILLSLCLLCALFFRSRGGAADTSRGDALLESLKQMVREAERAGSDLSAELSRQQRSLRQSLLEIDSAEERLRGLVRENDERYINHPRYANPAIRTQSNEPILPEELSKAEDLEISSAAARYERVPQSEPKKNVYGEVIKTSSTGSFSDKGSRNEPVAVSAAKIVRRPESSKPLHKSLEDIYSAAEQMLKAGGSIKFVANYTNLPIDEVKKLSSMLTAGQNAGLENQVEVINTSSSSASKLSDPRLGVLGMGQLGEKVKRVEV